MVITAENRRELACPLNIPKIAEIRISTNTAVIIDAVAIVFLFNLTLITQGELKKQNYQAETC